MPAVGLAEEGGALEICLWHGGESTRLVSMAEWQNRADQAQNGDFAEVRFAAAIAYGLGVTPDIIAGALRSVD